MRVQIRLQGITRAVLPGKRCIQVRRGNEMVRKAHPEKSKEAGRQVWRPAAASSCRPRLLCPARTASLRGPVCDQIAGRREEGSLLTPSRHLAPAAAGARRVCPRKNPLRRGTNELPPPHVCPRVLGATATAGRGFSDGVHGTCKDAEHKEVHEPVRGQA